MADPMIGGDGFECGAGEESPAAAAAGVVWRYAVDGGRGASHCRSVRPSTGVSHWKEAIRPGRAVVTGSDAAAGGPAGKGVGSRRAACVTPAEPRSGTPSRGVAAASHARHLLTVWPAVGGCRGSADGLFFAAGGVPGGPS